MPSSRPVIHPLWNARNRPAAESVLTDTAMITRASTGPATVDRTTFVGTNPLTVVVGSTPCRVEIVHFHPSALLVGEQRVTVRQYDVQVPHGVDTVLVDDLVTVTASQDAALVGRVLRVLSVTAVSYEWTRVLRCQSDEG